MKTDKEKIRLLELCKKVESYINNDDSYDACIISSHPANRFDKLVTTLTEQIKPKEYDSPIIQKMLDEITPEDEARVLKEMTETPEPVSNPIVAKSGRKYRSIPEGMDVETWDAMTPTQRLEYKGLLLKGNSRVMDDDWKPKSNPDELRSADKPTKGDWKLIGHSYAIADTGDYDGCYEITDGKISILTKDDDDEALQPIVNALNDSGCKFYQDDAVEFENELLKQELKAAMQSTPSGITDEEKRTIRRKLIKTIHIDEANFDHIRKHGQSHGINGTLLIEIERIMEEYVIKRMGNTEITTKPE
jgi:hypothetical protein